MRIFLFTILAILFFSNAYGQDLIRGKVVDRQTKEPLAFVNIILNENPTEGTFSDIDGGFYYPDSPTLLTLTCSYIGYEKSTISLLF